MATDLSALIASIKIEVDAKVKKAGVDLGIPEAVLQMAKLLSLAFGSGLGQADQIFWDRRVIAGAGNDPLDLVGTLTNPHSGTVNFANIKAIVIFNRSDETLAHSGGDHTATDAGIVVLDTSSTFQGPCKTLAKGHVIEAGGMYLITNPLAAGWAIVADTGDTFQVDNEDGSDEALYDILLIGDST